MKNTNTNTIDLEKVAMPISITGKIKKLEKELESDAYSEKEKKHLKREISAMKLERMSKTVRPYFFTVKLVVSLAILGSIVIGSFVAFTQLNAGLRTSYESDMQEVYQMIDENPEYSDLTEDQKIEASNNYLKRLNPKYEKFMD